MDKNKAQDILQKYHTGTCTEEEKALAEDWIIYGAAGEFDLTELELLEDLLAIRQGLSLNTVPSKTVRLWPRIVAAASILLLLSIGGYVVLHTKRPQKIAKNQRQDVAPGSNKAILTLANGHIIVLDNAKNGTIARQGLTSINKKADGELVYDPSAVKNNTATLQYNTIATPRGGQYHLILADGTNVWLNAASSIKYPIVFSGTERKVEITGEAYFEVSHNAAMPFRVAYKNILLEDIGTHFNINAYDDEPVIRTTLLEGGIAIAENNHTVVLKPGQQAVSVLASGKLTVKDADMEEAVAWKNGYFVFDNESLQGVMRKIARWYNVTVEYPSGDNVIANYWGSMSRESNISVVLKKLEATNNVHFKVEQNKVMVFKKYP